MGSYCPNMVKLVALSLFLLALVDAGSWDAYIDNVLAHTGGHGDAACIIGQDGSIWTTPGHPHSLKITYAEAGRIGRAMKSGDFSPFQARGIKVAGVKYRYLRGDGNLLLGTSRHHGAITLQASKTAVVICHTREGGSQGNVNKGVAVIAEYL